MDGWGANESDGDQSHQTSLNNVFSKDPKFKKQHAAAVAAAKACKIAAAKHPEARCGQQNMAATMAIANTANWCLAPIHTHTSSNFRTHFGAATMADAPSGHALGKTSLDARP